MSADATTVPQVVHPCLDGRFRSSRPAEDLHLLTARHAWRTTKRPRYQSYRGLSAPSAHQRRPFGAAPQSFLFIGDPVPALQSHVDPADESIDSKVNSAYGCRMAKSKKAGTK